MLRLAHKLLVAAYIVIFITLLALITRDANAIDTHEAAEDGQTYVRVFWGINKPCLDELFEAGQVGLCLMIEKIYDKQYSSEETCLIEANDAQAKMLRKYPLRSHMYMVDCMEIADAYSFKAADQDRVRRESSF